MRCSRLSIAVLAALVALAVAVTLAVAGARARGPSQWKTVGYLGVVLRVPHDWPVYDLARRPRTCVRFDRHAVYLGSPGRLQTCPPHALGRTEAILVTPDGVRNSRTTAAARPAADQGRASATDTASVQDVGARATVVATWRADPSVIETALGDVDKRDTAQLVSQRLSHRRRHERRGVTHGADVRPAQTRAPARNGTAFTGDGFDTCEAPSAAAMKAWRTSPYRAVGVYIGGANLACAQPQLTRAWVRGQSRAGWRLLPIYAGPQAPTTTCGGCSGFSAADASAEGAAAARDAIAHARRLGVGAGGPIYYDMEDYSRSPSTSAAVLTFLGAWTTGLHAAGYLSGVYAGVHSGMRDLIAASAETVAPDELWTADWNGSDDAADPGARSRRWATNQRVHQFAGAVTQTFGGVTLGIDRDAVDAPVATAGAATARGRAAVRAHNRRKRRRRRTPAPLAGVPAWLLRVDECRGRACPHRSDATPTGEVTVS